MLWLLPWFLLLAAGIQGIYLCLADGLYHTALDNRYAFGIWIFLDLTVIALGAGAFFSGFLLYVLRRKELEDVIRSAVVLGFLCYSGAVGVLAVDVGQPIRAWFTFWHPNVHSMLTEVTFCISCYLCVLLIEYVPIILKNRKLKRVPGFLVFELELHKIMVAFAVVGTFLSFFHQGSLGGLYGVLKARPFVAREGLALWPSTFFLFILSAIASGPSFLLLITKLAERLTAKKLVRTGSLRFLGRLSGWLLAVYVVFKTADTLLWLNRTAPSLGFLGYDFYQREPFGTWVLFLELGLFGLVPALMLLSRRISNHPAGLVTGAFLACFGVALNRFVLTVQNLALPTLPFDEFMLYWPSWPEVAAFAAVVAYGFIVFSLSYRYLPLYPYERPRDAA
jgi:molybdopterin-containing oxidoreductase family membrane subunit